jgi:hypothetical protein
VKGKRGGTALALARQKARDTARYPEFAQLTARYTAIVEMLEQAGAME